MIGSNIARRYAKAILEIGVESGSLDAIVRELEAIAQAYEASAELRAVLENPQVAIDAKRAVLAEIAGRVGAGPMTANLVRMLTDRRRMAILPQVAHLVIEMADARKGVVHAEISSAVRLSDAFYTRLQRELERVTGQRIVIDLRIDPTLVGGVSARIGDMIIDGSLRANLHEMRNTLLAAEVTRSNGAAAPIASA